ncbi:MAG: hypothetical protein EOS10_22540 [Mesorhizobium sp.]|uniref:hypothetical protein n=1 Tax=Mesorhizobium sp. TaxID=1871066 RepID=UPI000FE97726|nr:hypothetical protein [Mesorhizobium sp.]RWO29623.1 MAG: hypothetical protein EOS10_22540 [Mesorhizobium sp.]
MNTPLWTPQLEAARIDLCKFWLKVADPDERGIYYPELGVRAYETEQALTILGDIASRAAASAALIKALKAASHALRSYQYGNSATDLAQSTADFCDEVLKSVGEAP